MLKKLEGFRTPLYLDLHFTSRGAKGEAPLVKLDRLLSNTYNPWQFARGGQTDDTPSPELQEA